MKVFYKKYLDRHSQNIFIGYRNSCTFIKGWNLTLDAQIMQEMCANFAKRVKNRRGVLNRTLCYRKNFGAFGKPEFTWGMLAKLLFKSLSPCKMAGVLKKLCKHP